MRDRAKAGAEARGGQKGKEEQEEIRHANNQHFPLTLSQFKHAQTVMAITLLVLCTIGSLLLDQTSLIGNRILMPVLTILLTSANEFIYGLYELCEERHLTKRAVTAVAFGLVLFTLGAICFGAPLRRSADTVNWAFFLSALTMMPGACLLTDDIDQWKRAYLFAKPKNIAEKTCCTLFYTPILGGWLGAWVICLDWNQSWQVWPIPSFLGALAGYFVGSLYLRLSYTRDLRRHRAAVQAAAALQERERERELAELKKKAEEEEENKAPEDATPEECNESNWWLFL